MSNWNEADHPRDDEGKFTFKGGSSGFSSSGRETNEEKMQRRADTLYPSMRDKKANNNQIDYSNIGLGNYNNGTLTGGAANSSYSNKTIAGVKQGNPMSFEQAMSGVNPNYDKNEKYKLNCSASSAVFIARMKGYDIEALPYDNTKEYVAFTGAPNIAFIDPKTGTTPKFTSTEAKSSKELNLWLDNNIKQGGMYMFSYNPYSDTTESHVIITLKNPKGALIFYDPQNSKFYDKNLPENIAYYKWDSKENKFEQSSPKVLRVDDKELDTNVFERFSKKKE